MLTAANPVIVSKEVLVVDGKTLATVLPLTTKSESWNLPAIWFPIVKIKK
jgi:hypothetical protein